MSEKNQTIHKVCVYCASSSKLHSNYLNSAFKMGTMLAEAGIAVVYGGGAVGLMGSLADGVLAGNGTVIGVIPKFMVELEWAHKNATEMHIVDTMHERKHLMIQYTDAVIALPGGSGTLEELLETISLKRLGIYLKPIIIVNTGGFYDPLIAQLDRCIKEKFMTEKHGSIWSVVTDHSEVLQAIRNAPDWSEYERHSAAV